MHDVKIYYTLQMGQKQNLFLKKERHHQGSVELSWYSGPIYCLVDSHSKDRSLTSCFETRLLKIQDIPGGGFPVASQDNVTPFPSTTVRLCVFSLTEGRPTKQAREVLYLQQISQIHHMYLSCS